MSIVTRLLHRTGPVEDYLWYLATLHPRALTTTRGCSSKELNIRVVVTHVGGLCAALELEGDGLALADHHLAQPLLPEVGELRPVQHGGGRVRLVSLDL